MSEIRLKPVGFVRNSSTEPSLVARSGDLDWSNANSRPSHSPESVSEIAIEPGYADILDGVEDCFLGDLDVAGYGVSDGDHSEKPPCLRHNLRLSQAENLVVSGDRIREGSQACARFHHAPW